jgi:hypothetical protein
MADWPELGELKQILDITSEDWDGDDDDSRLTRVLSAAIARVKTDVGHWDEMEDEPDDNLAQAALRMAELIATRPAGEGKRFAADANAESSDPTYLRLLKGRRRVFGVA